MGAHARVEEKKFHKAADLARQLETYQLTCEATGTTMTIPGGAVSVGLKNRAALMALSDKNIKFEVVVQRFCSQVEDQHLQGTGKPALDIFALKNMGYTDRDAGQLNPVTININGKDAKF